MYTDNIKTVNDNMKTINDNFHQISQIVDSIKMTADDLSRISNNRLRLLAIQEILSAADRISKINTQNKIYVMPLFDPTMVKLVAKAKKDALIDECVDTAKTFFRDYDTSTVDDDECFSFDHENVPTSYKDLFRMHTIDNELDDAINVGVSDSKPSTTKSKKTKTCKKPKIAAVAATKTNIKNKTK